MGAVGDKISRTPHIREARLPMSDCLVKPPRVNGPFSKGAISRAVSLPTERTSEAITERFTPRARGRTAWPSGSAVPVESESNRRARRARKEI